MCDNATGDPVDMNLGQDASRLTLGIVSVNAEASNMLHSYVARPLRGETYQMYTEGCPYNIGTLESQVCGHPCERRIVIQSVCLETVLLLAGVGVGYWRSELRCGRIHERRARTPYRHRYDVLCVYTSILQLFPARKSARP